VQGLNGSESLWASCDAQDLVLDDYFDDRGAEVDPRRP
jgi:hypothetical protein